MKGLYKFKAAPEKGKHRAQIFGSGPIINEALRAQTILAEKYGVAADVWSATNYKWLRNDALQARRWNMLHPTETPRKSYVENLAGKGTGPVHRGFRQYEGRSRPDRAVGSGRFDDARHGRLWPQRHRARIFAASLKWMPN